MLSSNSSSCNHNPKYTPFSENDITSFTSTSEDPNFFFGFPNSPHTHFQDYYQDNQSPWIDLTHVYLNSPPHYSTAAAAPIAGNSTTNRLQRATGVEVRPASQGKKNRHSKINTARGPRDRRMRLSLDIARKFFDLQDLLGFDKASRTVDWLLRSSSAAIRAIACGMPGGCGEYCTTDDYCGEGEGVASSATAAACSKGRKGKRVKRGVQQKRVIVARESRRNARERARERTSQKRRLMRETGTGGVPMYGAGVQVVEDFSSDEAQATTQWDSFNLHHTHTAPFFPQDEQMDEFEFNGKPWEAYNSFNMSG